MFKFIEFPDLKDNEIKLIVKGYQDPDLDKGYGPRYIFSIILIETNEEVGEVYFMVDKSVMQYLCGHISYGVSPEYRGHNYALKACLLIKNVALAHGFSRVFIGANHDNVASIKTIEKLGAVPITKDDVPEDEILKKLQEKKTDMFVWNIS